MSLVFGLLGLLVGFLVFIGAALVAPALPEQQTWLRWAIANFFEDLAAKSYHRPRLRVTPHGDVAMEIASYDVTKEADKISVDNPEWYADANRAVTRWRGKTFGIVYSEHAEVLEPADVSIAQGLYQLKDNGDHRRDVRVRPDGGEANAPARIQTQMSPYVTVPKGLEAVDIRNVEPRRTQSYEPNDPQKVEEDVKKSQQGYKDRSPIEMMLVLMAAGLGMGMAYLIYSNSGGGGTANIDFSLLIGGGLL